MDFPAEEIRAFDQIYQGLVNAAWRWDLWGAAYVINRGCDAACFEGFCAGLVGLGREPYQTALADPNSLVRFASSDIDFTSGRLFEAARAAYKNVAGKRLPAANRRRPRNPVGKRWLVRDLPTMYPELAARYVFRLNGGQPRRRGSPKWACEMFWNHGEATACDDCLQKFKSQGSKTVYSDMPPRVTFGRGWFSVGAMHWFDAPDDAVFPARDGSRVLARAVCGGICDVTISWAPRAERECGKRPATSGAC